MCGTYMVDSDISMSSFIILDWLSVLMLLLWFYFERRWAVFIKQFQSKLLFFYSQNTFPSFGKMAPSRKTFFLTLQHFLWCQTPLTFDRVITTTQKCAFLDYCNIFHFLCDKTCLSSQMHAPVLLHFHWNIVHFQL